MAILNQFLSEEIIYALGWTIVHSIWQGILVALFLFIGLKSVGSRRAHLRHEMSIFSMFFLLILVFATFIFHLSIAQTPSGVSFVSGLGSISLANPSSGFNILNGYINAYAPYLVSIWVVGIVVFSIRIIGGLSYIFRLQCKSMPLANQNVQEILCKLMAKTHLKKAVRLVESSRAQIPMTLGHIKPIILLPVGLITYLTPKQVETLIAHELAHIIRNDFLINFLLTSIETLFYYHPAVWWMASQVREEREAACDTIAVKLTGNPVIYAQALYTLKTYKPMVNSLVMGIFSKRKALLKRISRILDQPVENSHFMERVFAIGIIFTGLFLLSFTTNPRSTPDWSNTNKSHLQITKMASFEILQQDDTIPKTRYKHRIKTQTDHGEIRLLMKGEEIQELYINGTKIDPSEYVKYEREIEKIKSDIAQLPPPPPPAIPSPPESDPTPPTPPSKEAPPSPALPEAPPTSPVTPEQEINPLAPQPPVAPAPPLPPPPPPETKEKQKSNISPKSPNGKKEEDVKGHNHNPEDKLTNQFIEISIETESISDREDKHVLRVYNQEKFDELKSSGNDDPQMFIEKDQVRRIVVERIDAEDEKIDIEVAGDHHLGKLSDELKFKLIEDGIIDETSTFTFTLSTDEMKVDGLPLPESTHENYRNWWHTQSTQNPTRFKIQIKQQ